MMQLIVRTRVNVPETGLSAQTKHVKCIKLHNNGKYEYVIRTYKLVLMI